jgi:hypothetical protein
MNKMKRVLFGLIGGVALAVSLTGAPAQAQPVQDTAGIEVAGLSALKPPASPPKVTKANTVKAKGTKVSAAAHPGPYKTGSITTQATTACATWPTKACYKYEGGLQNVTSGTGLYANVMVPWSYTDYKARDAAAHDVTELAVIKPRSVGGPRDIVEWGLISDRGMSPTGNDEMRVFAGAWVNGTFQGYNVGFVNYTGAGACAYHPGDSMGAVNGTAHAFGIEYLSGNWWASIDSQYCGYFPGDTSATSTAGNLWYGSGANFVSGTQGQAFGEVTSAFNEPCTDMGSGTQGTASTSGTYNYPTMPAYLSTVSWAGGSPATSLTLIDTGGPYYSVKFLTGSVKTVYYGGTGGDSSGNTPGTRGSC